MATASPRLRKEVLDKKGKKTGRTQMVPPPLGEFATVDEGKALGDKSARSRFTWSGKIRPLIAREGKPVLARWESPPEVKSVVVFDGVSDAGAVYTEALERIVLELDRERGATVKRNRYWGHVVWESKGFVIDVATSGYRSLQAARPREHRGVDIITGVINPTVKHNESALILKDYVGPYAGGKGDWAVMAASELKAMKVIDGSTLRVHSRGVTRVTRIGEQDIALKNAKDFERVENQLYVWERMWKGERAFSIAEIPGGRELHFSSKEPVEIVVSGK